MAGTAAGEVHENRSLVSLNAERSRYFDIANFYRIIGVQAIFGMIYWGICRLYYWRVHKSTEYIGLKYIVWFCIGTYFAIVWKVA